MKLQPRALPPAVAHLVLVRPLRMSAHSPRSGYRHPWALAIACSAMLIAASREPSYSLRNASSSDVYVTLNTVLNPTEKPRLFQRGWGESGYRDDTEFLLLRVTYPNGKVVTLDRDAIRHIKHTSRFRRGVWWIDDSGVSYISKSRSDARRHQ